MTKQARNELIVGLVFFAAMAFLGIYTIVISGVFKGPTKTYLVSFPRIYGLKKGDVVRVEGLDRGEVIDLRLSPKAEGEGERVNAKLKVSTDVEIYKDQSEVKVTPFSPLGGRVIEIKRGFDGPRGKHVSLEEAKSMNMSDTQVMIIGTAEGELLQTLNALVEENKPGIARIVSNLATVSDKLTKTDNVLGSLINDSEVATNLQQMSSNLNSTASRLENIVARIDRGDGVIGELVARKSRLHDNLNGAAENANYALGEANVMLSNANKGKSAIGVLVSDDPVVTADAKTIVRGVASIASDVAAGRGTLGKLVKDDRLYDKAADTFDNVASITSRVASPGTESVAAVLLTDPDAGKHVRSTLEHLDQIASSVDRGEGALGLIMKDPEFRDRVNRIFKEVERLTVEFRDSVEDLREQAPINAFLGAVFAAF
ncbi:MCE family protein [bacterium]|nr:MCE family protein [bacterium]